MFFIKNTINIWKEKAVERRVENKALKKRLKELIKSRDNWRNKAVKLKAEISVEKKKFTFFQRRAEKAKTI